MKFRTWIVITMIVGLAASAVAQKQGAKAWYAKAPITRVKKPNHNTGNVSSKPVTASLLTIQWHMMRRLDGNRSEVVDPRQPLKTGDQVKLSITANQDGYLYIINQPEGKDGVLLFPDPLVNDGKNFIKKDQEYLLPYRCEDKPDPEDCWLELSPPAGTETMILIFSRDQITTLPNEVSRPGDAIKPEVVADLKTTSQQKVKESFGNFAVPGRKAVPFATRVKNTNTRDNEDMITTIAIKHG
ncbi:MAG: DUF4384 domain-containing protein [Acidobacteriota bacterium]